MLTSRSVPVAPANRTVAPKNTRVAAATARGRSGSTTSLSTSTFLPRPGRPDYSSRLTSNDM